MATIEQQLEQALADLSTAKQSAETAQAEALKALGELDKEKARADKAETDLQVARDAHALEKEGRETLAKEVEKLKAEAKTSWQQAAEICAAARIDALRLGAGGEVKSKAGAQAPEPITKAEFDAMHSTEKAEFSRNGGQIVG